MPSNRAPTANLIGPATVRVGEAAKVDALATTDPDGTVRRWSIEWGDGDRVKFAGKPGQAEHAYAEAGSYDIVLTVWDDKRSLDTAKLAIEVLPLAVDCVLSDWSSWSGWSAWTPAPAGGTESRTRTRTRDVITPPANDGAPCGPLSEQERETRDIVVPGPVPVDCVLSLWAMTSSSAWGPCQPNGLQARTETWARTVVTPPAHGGQACGPLTEQRQATQACVYVPPVVGKGPHDFFDAWAPSAALAYSLRNQAQIDALSKCTQKYIWNGSANVLTTVPKFSCNWKYDPANDTHPLKQDGAKLYKPKRIDCRLREPSGAYTYPELAVYGDVGNECPPPKGAIDIHFGIHGISGTLLIIFDLWWGAEFQTNRGTRDAYKWSALFDRGAPNGGQVKTYQVLHETYKGGDTLNDPANIPTILSKHHDDSEGLISTALQYPDDTAPGLAPGISTKDPFNPTGLNAAPLQTFHTYSNKWTRYWLEIKLAHPWNQFQEWEAATGATMVQLLAKDGTGGSVEVPYDRVSLWVADEDRDPQRVLYRVPFTHSSGNRAPGNPGLSKWTLLFDSSTINWNGTDAAGQRIYDPSRGGTGPEIGYVRNWLLLKRELDEADTQLFRRPVR